MNRIFKNVCFETRCIAASVAFFLPRNDKHLKRRKKEMVRALGIEPRTPAWKAGVLPLNYARDTVFIKPERFPIVKVISNHQVAIPNA